MPYGYIDQLGIVGSHWWVNFRVDRNSYGMRGKTTFESDMFYDDSLVSDYGDANDVGDNWVCPFAYGDENLTIYSVTAHHSGANVGLNKSANAQTPTELYAETTTYTGRPKQMGPYAIYPGTNTVVGFVSDGNSLWFASVRTDVLYTLTRLLGAVEDDGSYITGNWYIGGGYNYPNLSASTRYYPTAKQPGIVFYNSLSNTIVSYTVLFKITSPTTFTRALCKLEYDGSSLTITPIWSANLTSFGGDGYFKTGGDYLGMASSISVRHFLDEVNHKVYLGFTIFNPEAYDYSSRLRIRSRLYIVEMDFLTNLSSYSYDEKDVIVDGYLYGCHETGSSPIAIIQDGLGNKIITGEVHTLGYTSYRYKIFSYSSGSLTDITSNFSSITGLDTLVIDSYEFSENIYFIVSRTDGKIYTDDGLRSIEHFELYKWDQTNPSAYNVVEIYDFGEAFAIANPTGTYKYDKQHSCLWMYTSKRRYTIPFTVTSTVPTADATRISPSTSITINFSYTPDATTITAATLLVAYSTDGGVSYTNKTWTQTSLDGTELIIQPTTSFTAGAKVRVKCLATIKDTDGIALTAYTFYFTILNPGEPWEPGDPDTMIPDSPATQTSGMSAYGIPGYGVISYTKIKGLDYAVPEEPFA